MNCCHIEHGLEIRTNGHQYSVYTNIHVACWCLNCGYGVRDGLPDVILGYYSDKFGCFNHGDELNSTV